MPPDRWPALALLALLPVAAAGPAAADAEPLRADPCHAAGAASEAQLDRLRAGVQDSVCSAARWFDGLFGDPREHAETYGDTYGRVGLALSWDERDEFDVNGSFRAGLALPILGQRFNAVIGRDSTETFIDDSYDDAAFLPGSFSDDSYAKWYAGLNYLAASDDRSVFDLGGGIKLESPLNPYVRARYRHFLAPRPALLLTLRSTAFWENDDGFGVTLGADSDWSIDDARLLRWANTATLSQGTEGVRWRSRLSLYDALDARSAMRYQASVQGQTDGVQPDYYGLRATYRRSAWRDWFFLEFSGSLFWSDGPEPGDRCDACLGASIGFEILFGDKYDRWLGRAAAGEE